MILDIGPNSAKALADIIAAAGTVVWNGPVGVFEMDAFANGTKALAQPSRRRKITLAGGGDTVSAINVFRSKTRSVTSRPLAAPSSSSSKQASPSRRYPRSRASRIDCEPGVKSRAA